MTPKECILDALRIQFPHYNDTLLGRVADEILDSLLDEYIVRNKPTKHCFDCIYSGDLAVYTPNPASLHLCQKGCEKGSYVADKCVYYFNAKDFEVNNDK